MAYTRGGGYVFLTRSGEREGKVDKVTSWLYFHNMGRRPQWTDFHGWRGRQHNHSEYNFCFYILGLSDLHGVKLSIFPQSLLVITTVQPVKTTIHSQQIQPQNNKGIFQQMFYSSIVVCMDLPHWAPIHIVGCTVLSCCISALMTSLQLSVEPMPSLTRSLFMTCSSRWKALVETCGDVGVPVWQDVPSCCTAINQSLSIDTIIKHCIH